MTDPTAPPDLRLLDAIATLREVRAADHEALRAERDRLRREVQRLRHPWRQEQEETRA